MKVLVHIFIAVLFLSAVKANAQTDTTKTISVRTDSTTSVQNPALTKDTIRINGRDSVPKHDPRKATFRSAVLPGWGQAYNKEHWKIPIVYAALSVPAGFFIYNQTWYKRTKLAYQIKFDNDSLRFPKIHPKIKDIGAESLRFYRNEFRRNKDYAILYFLAAWGLNVADATVFGHLKDFDVSDDLSFKIKPGYSPMSNTTGLSLVLAVRNSSDHIVKSSR